MTMKCPECKSEKFYTRENDPTLMDCEGCHGVCSTGYAKGFWIGYLEASTYINRSQIRCPFTRVFDTVRCIYMVDDSLDCNDINICPKNGDSWCSNINY